MTHVFFVSTPVASLLITIASLMLASLTVPSSVAADLTIASAVDRSPAIIGPATDEPVGDHAEYYRDYLEHDVHLEGSDS